MWGMNNVKLDRFPGSRCTLRGRTAPRPAPSRLTPAFMRKRGKVAGAGPATLWRRLDRRASEEQTVAGASLRARARRDDPRPQRRVRGRSPEHGDTRGADRAGAGGEDRRRAPPADHGRAARPRPEGLALQDARPRDSTACRDRTGTVSVAGRDRLPAVRRRAEPP